MNLLIAENDCAVVDLLKSSFELEYYGVDFARDAEESMALLQSREYAAVIVDLDLPAALGSAILHFVLSAHPQLPVVALTSREHLPERVHILDSGADDVVQKPFAFSELSARLRAVLRRTLHRPPAILRLADLELNRVERTVTRTGRTISLTPREFSLLEYLMQRQGRHSTRADIIEHVWKLSADTLTNIVDVYINYLRQKVDGRGDCKLIHTVRGVGYELRSSPRFQLRDSQNVESLAVG